MTAPAAMLDHALAYAGVGWHVLPLHTPRPGGACSCGRRCSSPGKHPRTRNGVHDATTDEERIRTWWSMWPDANIGIACGPSGIVAIDVDPRHGGDESWAELRRQIGDWIDDTVSAQTGSGGSHYVYRAPPGARIGNIVSSERFQGALGPGIDVRGWGGYIVAPPSLHASGAVYAWYAGFGPDEHDLMVLPEQLQERIDVPAPSVADHTPVTLRELLDGVPEGERNVTIFRVAAKLRYVDVPVDLAVRLCAEIAERCTPPLPRAEVERTVRSAYRYEPGGLAVVTSPVTQETPQPDRGARRLLGELISQPEPPTDWVVEPVLVGGRVHLLYGEPESGKTIVALSWALSLIGQGHNVLFVDEEGGEVAIAGLLRSMGADPETVDRHLHYLPAPGLGQPEDLAWLTGYAAGIQARMVLIDSLTDMLAIAGVDENAGTEVTGWMVTVAQAIAHQPHAPAVVLVDHIPKDAENTRYAVGSRAKKAKSDVLWLVTKVAPFDRTTIGQVRLTRHKNRPGVLPDGITYTVGGKDGRLVCHPFDPSQDGITGRHPRADEVLDLLDREGPMSAAQIGRQLGISRWSAARICQSLEADGHVRMTGSRRSGLWERLVHAPNRLVHAPNGLVQEFGARPPLYRGRAPNTKPHQSAPALEHDETSKKGIPWWLRDS